MYRNENLEKIMGLHRRCGDVQFRMAIQHLVDKGWEQFTEETVAETKKMIHESQTKTPILTPEFQCSLLDCAYELSRFHTWDVLLYVKLYLGMKNDDIASLDEAEQALCTYNSIGAPEAWKIALADPHLRDEIVRNMVRDHRTEYTPAEIKEAICTVVDDDME